MLRILIKYAYQVLVSLYGVSIKIVSHINAKAKEWNNGRKGQWKTLKSWDNKHQKEKRIWMHCASSGEFLQGKPILEKYKAADQEILIIVSFFSPSGYNQFKNDEIAELIFYLPLDTKSNAQRLLNIINPSLVLFIKNEFWFNIIDIINKSGIPLFFISSVIGRKDHIFLPFMIDVMKNVNHIFVQDKASLNNLKENGFINTSLSGDSRIDNVQNSKGKATDFPNLLSLKSKYSNCIIYGSIWKEDLKLLYRFINQRKDLLHIIAPHEVGKENIKKCCDLIKGPFSLYSNLEKEIENNIIIVDSIGQLKSMYSVADIVYIGGGFGKGIHNTLEPASYSIPVIFGPRFKKFKEAKAFINMGTASSVQNLTEFNNAFHTLINAKDKVKDKMTEYFKSNSGATEYIYEKIDNYS